MCHSEVFSHIIIFMILCQSVKVRLNVKSIPWPYMVSDLQRLNFFLEIYQAFNLCGHAVGEHFVKVSTIISESVNQSLILYHRGGTYQTTRNVSECGTCLWITGVKDMQIRYFFMHDLETTGDYLMLKKP